MKVHPIGRRELWFVQATLFAAIVLQALAWAINSDLTFGPHNVIIATELALAVLLGLMAGKRHLMRRAPYRTLSFVFLALISIANIVSVVLVTDFLLSTSHGMAGREILVAALAIFITNIIVYALWYWEIDSPGMTGTRWSKHDKDLQFTQQDIGKDFEGWQPSFIDYLYLSVTNAISFAPADARPITHQAKVLMGSQALISVFTLALILARSITVLS